MNILKTLKRHDSTPASLVKRKHIPWIQSPIEEAEPPSVSQNRDIDSSPPIPRFKHYDDDHTIELVYDMFIVAILSTFTSIHGIEDGRSLQNFVAFFTILWWSWLQTVMFDVRFGVDSIYDRVCKAITLCVTVAFMLGGSVWEIDKIGENKKGFTLLAVTLMLSRVLLVIQYGVVAFYARAYRKTFLPLISIIAMLTLSAALFLVTFFLIEHKAGPQSHILFYIVTCVEGLGMMLISCCWRVVSFKGTRFTTRMTDSHMIMLGEGAVGLAVSVSKIMANSASISGSIGVTVAAVMLIYFTWMLYFDQIDTSRFGSIRVQIWAIMHYPLNLATVFLLEGMRELVAYNTITSVEGKWRALEPAYETIEIEELGGSVNLYDFSRWATTQDLVEYMKSSFKQLEGTLQSTTDFDKKFNSTPIYDYFTNDLISVEYDPVNMTLSASYEFSQFVWGFWDNWNNAIYDHFGVTAPKTDHIQQLNASSFELTPETADLLTPQLLQVLNDVQAGDYKWGKYLELFRTIFWYFPLGAAVFLFLLAAMYWFGRRTMSKYEWWSIVLRVVGGLGMVVYCVTAQTLPDSWEFIDSPWALPIVTLVFFGIVVGDNLIITWGNKAYDQHEGRVYEKELAQSQANSSGYQTVPSRGEGDVSETKLGFSPAVNTSYFSPSTPYVYNDVELVKVGGR